MNKDSEQRGVDRKLPKIIEDSESQASISLGANGNGGNLDLAHGAEDPKIIDGDQMEIKTKFRRVRKLANRRFRIHDVEKSPKPVLTRQCKFPR